MLRQHTRQEGNQGRERSKTIYIIGRERRKIAYRKVETSFAALVVPKAAGG